MNKIKIFTYLILCLLLLLFSIGAPKYVAIEEMDIPSGLGVDLKVNNDKDIEYKITSSVYNFTTEKPGKDLLYLTKASNLEENIQKRQLTAVKKYLPGLPKVFVISEEVAQYGLIDVVNLNFASRTSIDTSYCAVSKTSAQEILSHKIIGYPNAGDYIYGLIKNCIYYNFLSENYQLIDIYVRIDSLGRSLVLPYIEIKNGLFKITGLAIFNKDKMVSTVSIDEGKFLNILREKSASGLLELQKGPDKYTNFYAKSKRKVTLSKSGNNYVFNVDIKLQGDITANRLYKGIDTNEEIKKQFEKEMNEYVKKNCEQFIDKMKNEIKIDCLEYGRYIVAKNGHDQSLDLNNLVCNAKFNIKVNTKVDKVGRGEF